MPRLASGLFVLVAACGKEVADTPATAGEPDAETPAEYVRLIGRTWSVEAGNFAQYACARMTVPEDMYITNVTAQAGQGTHHAVLSLSGTHGTAGPDGEQDDCGVGTIGMVMLYASSVGTAPLAFPDGVAVKVSAGQQLHLNIHLSNAGDTPLSGETTILVKSSRTQPREVAEMVFAGTYALAIPPSPVPYDLTGGCVAADDYSLFAVWPHMHALGIHQTLDVIHDGRAQRVHDAAFSFVEQSYHRMSPIAQVHAGDEVRVTCRYMNTTGTTVTWGDGQNQEMCFAGLYRYPAANTGAFQCTDNPGQ